MSTRLASANVLTQYNTDGWYGYEDASYPMSAGGEAWFLVNPATASIAAGWNGQLAVSISNQRQSGALTVWEYTVDANSCLVGTKLQMTPDRDWFGYNLIYTPLFGYRGGYVAGQKYLFQVDSSQNVGIAAQWQVYNM